MMWRYQRLPYAKIDPLTSEIDTDKIQRMNIDHLTGSDVPKL
jgi:hypothetical protein